MVTCTYTNTQPGSITIIKNTVPDGAQDFAYTTTGSGLSGFSLDDDGVNTGTGGDILNTKVFNNLVPGPYSVTETLPVTGYDLTALVCIDSGTGTTTTETLATGEAAITLGAGGSVTCTYTNTQRGSITIIKNTVPDGAQDFAYTTTGSGLSGFSLDDDGVNTGTGGDILNTKVFNNLVPGPYSVTETLPVTGYDLTALVCIDSGTGTTTTETLATGEAAITLGAGGSVTCTYTNTQRGSITIIKNTVPDGAQDFAYTTTGSGLSGFSLDDDGVNTGTGGDILNTKVFNNLVPGPYSVTETLPVTGYDLTALVCIDSGTGTTTTETLATGEAAITLGAGGSVTCTYTNTQRGSITIIKNTVPDGAQDFAYTTTGSGLSGFSLDDDGVNTGTGGDILNTKVFNNLVPGPYSVTETLPVTGYDLTALGCMAAEPNDHHCPHGECRHRPRSGGRSPAPTPTPSAARSTSPRRSRAWRSPTRAFRSSSRSAREPQRPQVTSARPWAPNSANSTNGGVVKFTTPSNGNGIIDAGETELLLVPGDYQTL